MHDQKNEPDVVNVRSISSLQFSGKRLLVRENGAQPRRNQLGEKSAARDRVGLILALCPRYFAQEQLDDELTEHVGNSPSC